LAHCAGWTALEVDMVLHHRLFSLWVSLLLALGLVASAAAQRGGDDGDFLILSARYGTALQNADVTGRLRELAQKDRNVRITNELFGIDPHPNQVKSLRIVARTRDGRTQTFEYEEGATLDGAMFIGWAAGNWGKEPPAKGGWGEGPVHRGGSDDGDYLILQAQYGTAERHVDVTPRLKELARQDRRFRAGNDTFGTDPHPNQIKVLRIHARSRDGHVRTFEYPENSTVDGALFVGWAGGAWGAATEWRGGWGEARHPGGNDTGYGAGSNGSRLRIVSASYGADDRQRDITYRVRSRVINNRLDVGADNDLAGGDPAPGTVKTLWLIYSLDGGREQRLRIGENERLRLP
jgi:hypothetical protein